MSDSAGASLLEQVARKEGAYEALTEGMTAHELEALLRMWEFNARPKQLWPGSGGNAQACGPEHGCGHATDEWTTWAFIGGRGVGKTFTGAYATHRMAMSGKTEQIHLIGPSPSDYRDVMLEGPSGIMSIAPSWERPVYRSTKRTVEWPNGVRALCFCVDEATEALTRDRGWVRHHDLSPGDVIATLNTDTDLMEWQEVEDVHRFDVINEPVLAVTGRHVDSVTTEGHRWWLRARSGEGFWTTTESMRENGADEDHARLPVARPSADLPTSPTHPDALVELVAWYAAEGTLSSSGRAWITQGPTVNPGHAEAITRSCEDLFGPCREAVAGSNQFSGHDGWTITPPSPGRGTATWRLDASASRLLLSCFEDPTAKVIEREFILSLTEKQLRLLWGRYHDGDGHRNVVAQNSRARAENLSLVLTLLGEPHDLVPRDAVYDGAPYPMYEVRLRTRSDAWLKHPLEAAERRRLTGTVWCPQTPNRTWLMRRNGKQAFTGNSAHDPESLRGPQAGFIWADELAAWQYGEATWEQAQFGLRLGRSPRQIITTTPKPFQWLKDIVYDRDTHFTHATTWENLHNLAPTFRSAILKAYEGTRIGAQELEATFMDAVEGALWTVDMIERTRVRRFHGDRRTRCVVAVDPPAEHGSTSDEAGIVVVAKDEHGFGYVLEDASLEKASPNDWASAALAAYHRHDADEIVAEVNQGGDMVRYVIHSEDPSVRVTKVRATKGKGIRAHPVANLFERAEPKAFFLGSFPMLENQLTTWVPGQTKTSPDRLDALVWGLTHVMLASEGRLLV